jgi:hypothetical protein
MKSHGLSLTSIVTFRLWQFRNGHRNPAYGAIIFGMQDLIIMRHEMFGNELEGIPARPISLVKLLTRHPIDMKSLDRS